MFKLLKDSDTLMKDDEYDFLSELIKKHKPKKILELGVYHGAASNVILNTIKDMNSILYSVDLCDKTLDKKIGILAECHNKEVLAKWKLFFGKMAYKVMDKIGGDIDFCIIDTLHIMPGEIINVLEVLPFLAPNAVVVIHDTAIHTFPEHNAFATFMTSPLITLCILKGHKIDTGLWTRPIGKINIGAIILDSDIMSDDNIWPLFAAMSLPWGHGLNGKSRKKRPWNTFFSEKDIWGLEEYFRRFYKREWVDAFVNYAMFWHKRI